MRKRIFAANWKMNKTIQEARDFFNDFIPNIREISDREIVIAPPFTGLFEINNIIENNRLNIVLSAQNMYYSDSGAFTGEISPIMLKDIGVKRVIIGHSERRNIFGEDDDLISKKLLSAFRHNILPIFCIGEKLEERESNNTFDVIERQLTFGLTQLNNEYLMDLVIAYEPVWAIGTGRTASPSQAQEVHQFIRKWFEKKYNPSVSMNIKILYGGSVTPENIKNLMDCPDIDGVLVGGASLKSDLFTKIVKYDIL